MPEKFNELLLKQDIIELYNAGITPDYGYLMNGRFEKDMIKTLYPLKTLSGNPISWEASDTEYLFPVVSLAPKQAGSGDPSPENVRPISGYDSVTVTQSKDGSQVKQITLTLPETICDGTVDAVTGVGENTWKFVELDGTEDWAADKIGNRKFFMWAISRNPDDIPSSSNNILGAKRTQKCSHFVIENAYSTDVENCIWVYSTPTSNFPTIRLRSTANFTTVEELKSWLAAQASAGTPVQVAYKLATPEPFQATGNRALTIQPGNHTIYTDGDDITLSRKARRLEV